MTSDEYVERQKIFKPNLEDQQILDRHPDIGQNWTRFCRENLRRVGRKRRTELIDYIGNRMILVVFGLVLAAVTFMITNMFFIMVLFLCSASVITIGLISILGRWMVERRRNV